MDTKEKTTLDIILEAAKDEFLEKGFKAATLRGMASRAGLTTGAYYRHYSSKEEVFGALVSPTYDGLVERYRRMLDDFRLLPASEQQTEMLSYTKRRVSEMTDFMYDNMDAMKLILCASEGTEWSDLVHRLARLDTEATHDFAADSNEAGYDNVHLVSPLLEHMLTSGMFSMYFEIIVHDVPRKEADALISDLIEFYSAGWRRLMGF